MSKRPSIKTTKKQIVDWAQSNINSYKKVNGKYISLSKFGGDECGYGVDASEMDTHCWRCGHERPTERCHVIPHSLGGEDKPYNYRLFCHDCHLEQPNVNDYEATDKWVRETNVGMYNIFWKIRETYDSVFDDVTWHWGENLNNSTIEWMNQEINKRFNENNITPFVVSQEKMMAVLKR